MPDGTCSVDGCDAPAIARRCCRNHYARLRRSGTLPRTLLQRDVPPLERFHHSYEIVGLTGCWEWRKAWKGGGYGAFSVAGRSWRAHVWSYEQFCGPVPDGLEIDHLCRNILCVNPLHLQAVTRQENNRRRIWGPNANKLKTHCKHGHEFTPENTGIEVRPNGLVKRRCRQCLNVRSKALYWRDPEAARAKTNDRRRDAKGAALASPVPDTEV